MRDLIRSLPLLAIVGAGVLLPGGAANAAGRGPTVPAAAEHAAAEHGVTATTVTLYSSARPGNIAPQLYRPAPGEPTGAAVPGFAVISQDRTVLLHAGQSTLRIGDIAAQIDPTTVSFVSLTDPHTRVLEQTFQYDMPSTDRLLARSIGRPVTVERVIGNRLQTVVGTLLSASGAIVLRDQDGHLHALHDYSAIRFPAFPGGLHTQPALLWQVRAARTGRQRVRLSYQTGGMTWWADYDLVLAAGQDANSAHADLSAWVSIVNRSGATYSDARLKLMAGDIHRAASPAPAPLASRFAAAAMAPKQGFSQQSFAELHLYTLGRRITLPDDSTRRLQLFGPVRHIPVQRILVYQGQPQRAYTSATPITTRQFEASSNGKVQVYLEFRNEARAGLGMPLPAGRVRVSQRDGQDGSLELIGEDSIDHTPKGENVRVKLGSAFDVVGQRRQTDFVVNTQAHWMEEAIEITLHNHEDRPVPVRVIEHPNRWSNWKIVSKNHDFMKEDAHTLVFPVKVSKGGTATVRYRVHYAW